MRRHGTLLFRVFFIQMSYIDELVAKGYGGYRGWNDEAAVRADFAATGGQGKYTGGGATGSGGGVSNPADLAQQMYQQLQTFKQPAISTLQASRGNIPNIYAPYQAQAEAQKPLIEQQYQKTLGDITKYTTQAQSAEFGKRGIPLSSGVYDTSLARAIEPQTQAAALSRNTSLQGIQDLIGGFAGQQAQSNINLDMAISAIQSATGMDAISAAQALYNAQQQAQQQQASQALAQQQLALQQQQQTYQQSQPNYITLGEGQAVYDPVTLQKLFGLGKTYAPSTTSGGWE